MLYWSEYNRLCSAPNSGMHIVTVLYRVNALISDMRFVNPPSLKDCTLPAECTSIIPGSLSPSHSAVFNTHSSNSMTLTHFTPQKPLSITSMWTVAGQSSTSVLSASMTLLPLRSPTPNRPSSRGTTETQQSQVSSYWTQSSSLSSQPSLSSIQWSFSTQSSSSIVQSLSSTQSLSSSIQSSFVVIQSSSTGVQSNIQSPSSIQSSSTSIQSSSTSIQSSSLNIQSLSSSSIQSSSFQFSSSSVHLSSVQSSILSSSSIIQSSSSIQFNRLSSIQSSLQSSSSIIQSSSSIQFSLSGIHLSIIQSSVQSSSLTIIQSSSSSIRSIIQPSNKQLSSPTPISRQSSPGPIYHTHAKHSFAFTTLAATVHVTSLPKPQSTISAKTESSKPVLHHSFTNNSSNGMTLSTHYIVPSDPTYSLLSVNPSLVQSETFSLPSVSSSSVQSVTYSLPSINPSLTTGFHSTLSPSTLSTMDELMVRLTLPSPSHTTSSVTNHLVSLGTLPKFSSTVLLTSSSFLQLNPTTHHSSGHPEQNANFIALQSISPTPLTNPWDSSFLAPVTTYIALQPIDPHSEVAIACIIIHILSDCYIY